MFTLEQRERVLDAAREARIYFASHPGRDVVDFACDCDRYFWTGLSSRQTLVALRLVCWGQRPA